MPFTTTKPKQEMRDPRAFGQVGKSTGPEIPDVPDDYYLAMIRDVQENTSTYGGDSKDQYVIEFELTEVKQDNGKEITLRAYIAIPPSLISTGNLNENSNLYAFLIGLGYTDDNLEVDPAAWQGRMVRINVVNVEVKEGENKGQVRPRIKGYSAAEAAKKKLAPRAAPQPARQSVAPAAKATADISATLQQPSTAAAPADDDESF